MQGISLHFGQPLAYLSIDLDISISSIFARLTSHAITSPSSYSWPCLSSFLISRASSPTSSTNQRSPHISSTFYYSNVSSPIYFVILLHGTQRTTEGTPLCHSVVCLVAVKIYVASLQNLMKYAGLGMPFTTIAILGVICVFNDLLEFFYVHNDLDSAMAD